MIQGIGNTCKGGEILSKDAIRKIREAEAEAAEIRARGAERAKEILRAAEEKGARLCAEAEEQAVRENRQKLDLTRQKAEELLEKTREEARTEAAEIRQAGEDRTRDAVRMIVGGLYELCQ